MPRAEGDGGGVAAGGVNADKPSTDQPGLGGCWLGNAARTVTGPQGTNYVILGGTRYGLRLSQDSSMPPSWREESLERRRASSSRLEAKQQQQPGSLELTADCCCISRPRLLPLGSRIPLSWTSSGSGGSSSSSSSGGGGASARQPATTNNSRACWPPSLTDGPQQPVGQGAPLEQSGSHWTATKHRSLRLQEPAVTAVDRLQRFRWSGGSGGGGGGGSAGGSSGSKKSSSSSSSSSGRSSDKAERLRELTEKLKGPAPVPPPRRPSRVLANSPPPNELGPPQQLQAERQEEGRSSCRSYTFSEGSPPKPTRKLGRSESLGEEGYGEQVALGPEKHLVDGGEDRDALGLMEPRPSSLYPASRNSSQAPYRSASFGQADFTQHGESSGQLIANARRAAFAASAAAEKEARASTLPRARRLQDEPAAAGRSPATPSPADSAVGSSAEGLVVAGPTSDGSDGLACSPDEPGPAAVPPDPLPDRCIEPHEVIITPPQEDYRQDEEQEQQRLSAASDAPSEASLVSEVSVVAAAAAAAAPPGKLRRYRGDTSKRRKGVYITQWPEPTEPEIRNAAAAADRKLSAQSSEERDEDRAPSATPSDLSDCEGHTPKRYSKRPLRGPYGQMLEAEMAKPRVTDLVALDDDLRPRRKVSANLSFNSSRSTSSDVPPTPCHHRTTSSPSKLEGLPEPSPELLAELLRGSSERVARPPAKKKDTRTHIVGELYETESSYVEALHTLVTEYLVQLKKPENAHVVDAATVDEIFYQVPAILRHHEVFLQEIRKRIQTWDLEQTVGDVFSMVFTKPEVLETYTLFLDNWKTAKKSIKTCMSKPAFVKFLETMERGHRGKLGLDQLLIKPVQKFPRYELLIQRLLKHTDPAHEDHQLLTTALREIHELVVKINCHERESFEWEQQQSTLREVELLVEGIGGIVTNDRAFIRHDVVSIASNSGTRKERGLFLFSDLLVITSIKRRSGTIRKPSTSSCPNSLAGLVEANKYKMLMRIPLDDLEVMKAKDENLRRMAREVDHLREDCATLGNLQELSTKLHGAKQQLDELIKEMLTLTQKQLADRNASHSQLACLELTLNTQAGMENISVMFTKPDKRASWEESFNEAKQKLAASTDRRPVPEYAGSLPIRKTRAGLQFTCAAPTLANGQGVRDVWVCNSDGYVGQVCVLSLSPEPPQVTSCNGVCNSRILCVAGIPACTSVSSSDDSDSDDIPCADTGSVSLGGDGSSLDGGPTIDEDLNQPTMWLGTEDGCVHVYNCTDNIRIKKNKVKLQHSSAVHCIIYLDNKVFLSLANGDVTAYSRDHLGGWNTMEPVTLTVGTVASPVTKMLPVSGKLWCASHNSVKVLNTYSLEVEHCLVVASEGNRPITCMASSGGLGVWVSLHNSAVLKLYHAASYECLADVNIAPAVTSMLANCDDIIRQHKAACLRVTALLACNELLWIGTSAGVLLTVPIPHIKPSTQRMSQAPVVTGVQYGHTGHVRFLTSVELASPPKSEAGRPKTTRYSLKGSKSLVVQQSSTGSTGSNGSCGPERPRLLVISGGDGCEDFRGHPASAELQAGRDDSTNHLLLWKV